MPATIGTIQIFGLMVIHLSCSDENVNRLGTIGSSRTMCALMLKGIKLQVGRQKLLVGDTRDNEGN